MSRDFDAFTNRVNSTLLDLIKQKRSGGIGGGDGGAQQAFQEKVQQLAMQQQKQLGYDAMDARHNALYDKIEQDTALQKVFQGDMMPEQYAMKYGGGAPGETRSRGKTGDVTPYQVQQALQTEYENLPLGSPERAAGMGAYADSRRAALSKAMGESSATDIPLEDKIAAFQKRKAEEDAVELINYGKNRVDEYRDSKGNKVDKSAPGAVRHVALAGAHRELPSTVLAGLNKGADVPLTDAAKEAMAKADEAAAAVTTVKTPTMQDKPMSYPLGIMGTDAMFNPPKRISRHSINADGTTGLPASTSAPMGLDIPHGVQGRVPTHKINADGTTGLPSSTLAPMGLNIPHSKPSSPADYDAAPMGLNIPHSKPPQQYTTGGNLEDPEWQWHYRGNTPRPKPRPIEVRPKRIWKPAPVKEKRKLRPIEERPKRIWKRPEPAPKAIEVERNRKITQAYDELQQFIEDQKRLSRR